MKTPRSAHPTQTNGLQVPTGSDDAASGRRMTRRAAVLALGSSAVVALGGCGLRLGKGSPASLPTASTAESARDGLARQATLISSTASVVSQASGTDATTAALAEGSIIYGPRVGVTLGFLMGLLSLTVNTITILPTSYLFSPFVPNGNIYSAIIAIVPRVLIGLTPYLVYKILKNRTGLIFAGALGSLTNTVFVLGGIFFLFGNVFDGNIQKLLATVISTNSIAELVISAVLTVAIVPRLETLKK